MSTAMHAMLQKITSPQAHECIHQVIAYFSDLPTMEVHFTNTNGGDLRVRATHAGKQQNVFTMAWRPTLETFLCRLYTPTEECSLPKISAIEGQRAPKSTTEPLRCEFDYRPSTHNGALINLIHAAAGMWAENQ